MADGVTDTALPNLPLDQALGLAPVPDKLQTVNAEIETWFNDLRGNLNSVLDTEAHNKLYAAKEALKVRLAAIL
jgi:hypothetical protein